MDKSSLKTPGVYINEINAFPNSVDPVPTAVPAFVGYTPQALYKGKSYTNVPTKITSFPEFQAIFCYPDPPAPAAPIKQYSPEYYLVKQKSQPEKGDYMLIAGDYYSIVPDPSTVYYMYNSIRLFFENGGVDVYIVSVGTYGARSKKPMTPSEQIINSNVELDDLLGGLALLKNEEEPTMYICPEATLLSLENNASLMQAMLAQNFEMGTAISIFDIIGSHNPDPIMYMTDIENFRNATGAKELSYGCAYFPFVGTTIMQNTDIDFTNLFGSDTKLLAPLLNPPSAPNQSVATILAKIENSGSSDFTNSQLNNALMNASKTYSTIMKHILRDANMLPPSGAMAGVITMTDNQEGVWKAPANTSIIGAALLPINLSGAQQGDLNLDAVSGKSINAIRFFDGIGILIWGARTLDGNSLDWKYLPVRRTLIFLEQSCKRAAHAYVFEPNDKNTWEGVKAMISSFLTTVWKEGGLQGATPANAFSVECGLGSTMTAEDLLLGSMRVTIRVAVVHPAEFIILSFEQEMAKSS